MQMKQNPANPYLRTKVMTASPQELRLMLYDGAIKFCRQSAEALGRREYEASYNALMRAQKIVLELSSSLNHSVAPELCDKLSALYTYIYRRLVDANLQRTIEPVEEAIELLTYDKETWELLMTNLAQERQARPQVTVPSPVMASQGAGLRSTLSLNG